MTAHLTMRTTRTSACGRAGRLLLALGVGLVLCGPVLSARAAGAPPPPPIAQAAQSGKAAGADDIRDIRGPISIPSPWRWLAWGALAAAAVGLGLGVYRLARRRQPERPRLPHEIALARLEIARELMYAEQARAFSIEVSEAVRVYIEARFHLDAARRTTEEFLYELMARKDNPIGPQRDVLGAFLRYCDLGKFARWSLSLTDMEGMLASARDFITRTSAPTPAAQPAHQAQSDAAVHVAPPAQVPAARPPAHPPVLGEAR